MNERDRLMMIMESEHLNAKQFAEEVGISAGTLSNISGGRNKPSLDVMQAVLRRFRAISSQWLILGEGSMYLREGDAVPQQNVRTSSNTSNMSNNGSKTPYSASQTGELSLFPGDDNEAYFNSNNATSNTNTNTNTNTDTNSKANVGISTEEKVIGNANNDVPHETTMAENNVNRLPKQRTVSKLLLFYSDGTYEER